MFKLEKQRHLLKTFYKLNFNFALPNARLNKDSLSRIKLRNNQLKHNKSTILKQVYLLNKLYFKAIASKKRKLDENITAFVLNAETQNQNKLAYKLLTQEYQNIMKEIGIFENLEKIVKSNVHTYNELQKDFSKTTCQNQNSLSEKSNTFSQVDMISLNMPSISFCKNDVQRKISYVNDLLNHSTTCNFKGENYYEN